MQNKNKPNPSAKHDLDPLGQGLPVIPSRPSWLDSWQVTSPLREWVAPKKLPPADQASDQLEYLILETYRHLQDEGWRARCFFGPSHTSATIRAVTTASHCPRHHECGRVELVLKTDSLPLLIGRRWHRIDCELGGIAARDLLTHARQWAAAAQTAWQRLSTTEPPRKRGGPAPTPPDKINEIIAGWLRAQEQGIPQEVYCGQVGIGASTLRAWMRKMT